MPLSKEKIEQIRKDAKDYAKIVVKGPTQWDDENTSKKTGYIAGATAEAEKAQCLIEALEEVRNMVRLPLATGGRGDIEKIITAALQSYTNSLK